jgi:hypothetical protein
MGFLFGGTFDQQYSNQGGMKKRTKARETGK